MTPLIVVDWEERFLPLSFGQRRNEIVSCYAYGLRRYSSRFDFEKIGFDGSVCGYSDKGVVLQRGLLFSGSVFESIELLLLLRGLGPAVE
jgi:hypothetical protein